MTDIVERLRETTCDRPPFTAEHADCKCRLANNAADEIERLRAVLENLTRWQPAVETVAPELGGLLRDMYEARYALPPPPGGGS